MKFRKVTAFLTATAMTFGLMPVLNEVEIDAKAITQVTPVNVTIDQKTVTVDEAKNGVLVYVRVDTPLLNAIEFGTHVDDRCTYKVLPDSASVKNYFRNGEYLDTWMTYENSQKVKNMTWYAWASDHPDTVFSAEYANGTFDCMNLVALYVVVPEEYAIPGERFDIQYLSEGVVRDNGKVSHEIWRNTYTGTKDGIEFERQNYVELGLVNVQDGWIAIETQATEPPTTEPTEPPTTEFTELPTTEPTESTFPIEIEEPTATLPTDPTEPIQTPTTEPAEIQPVNISIDQKVVTKKEAIAGVPIYIRSDNAVLSGIEFGVKVDSRAEYTIVSSSKNALNLGGEPLQIMMYSAEYDDNSSWNVYAKASVDKDLVAKMNSGELQCMNLLMLNVNIPEAYAVAGAKFPIDYVAYNGMTTHLWKASDRQIDYVALGLVKAQSGWIEIEPEADEPSIYQKGDIDGSGEVDILDVLTLNQYLVGVSEDISKEGLAVADVDKDGFLTDADVMMILKSLVKLVTLD